MDLPLCTGASELTLHGPTRPWDRSDRESSVWHVTSSRPTHTGPPAKAALTLSNGFHDHKHPDMCLIPPDPKKDMAWELTVDNLWHTMLIIFRQYHPNTRLMGQKIGRYLKAFDIFSKGYMSLYVHGHDTQMTIEPHFRHHWKLQFWHTQPNQRETEGRNLRVHQPVSYDLNTSIQIFNHDNVKARQPDQLSPLLRKWNEQLWLIRKHPKTSTKSQKGVRRPIQALGSKPKMPERPTERRQNPS